MANAAGAGCPGHSRAANGLDVLARVPPADYGAADGARRASATLALGLGNRRAILPCPVGLLAARALSGLPATFSGAARGSATRTQAARIRANPPLPRHTARQQVAEAQWGSKL